MHGTVPGDNDAGAGVAEDTGHEDDDVGDGERHHQVQRVLLVVGRGVARHVRRVHHERVLILVDARGRRQCHLTCEQEKLVIEHKHEPL